MIRFEKNLKAIGFKMMWFEKYFFLHFLAQSSYPKLLYTMTFRWTEK